MNRLFAVVFACIVLTITTSSLADGARDWLSSGYVVSGYHSPASIWGPTIYHYGYFDYSTSDPWYRHVARPYLDNWYWPWYYQSGVNVYPVSYYRPSYYWYGSPWTYSVYYSN